MSLIKFSTVAKQISRKSWVLGGVSFCENLTQSKNMQFPTGESMCVLLSLLTSSVFFSQKLEETTNTLGDPDLIDWVYLGSTGFHEILYSAFLKVNEHN